MNQPARLIATTRFGVGVYDPAWWEARLALFNATVLPSLSRFRNLDFIWNILLDRDIPKNVYARIRESVSDAGAASLVNYEFVPNHSFMRDSVLSGIRRNAHPNQRVIFLMIDDDDAVGSTLFSEAFTSISANIGESQALTQPYGRALNAPTGEIGHLHYPSLTMNTLFYGTAADLERVIFTSHTKWMERSSSIGLRTTVLESPQKQFLYTYHHQGDGSYENRVASIEKWSPIGRQDVLEFGLDFDNYRRWYNIQASMPQTLGLTWRRTQPEQMQLARLKSQSDNVKQTAIETNSSIFDKDIPFFYMIYPLDGQTRPEGPVAFKGVGTPGATIRLSLAGSSGQYRPHSDAICDSVSGEFGIRANFRAGNWQIRIELLEDEVPLKEMTYSISIN